MQDILEVGVELLDGVGVRGVERQRDHGAHRGEVDAHTPIVVGDGSGIELAVVRLASVLGKIGARILVRAPNGGEARRLGGHDIHAVAVIGRHARHAGADELHDRVLHIAAIEHRADDCQRDVLWANAGRGSTLQIHCHHAGIGHVVGVAQQLLDQLAAALADGHRAQGAIAGVGVGAEDHLAAAGLHLAHVLVNDGDVRRDKDAAVLLCGGQAKDMIVLVDGTAHGAQGVVAVGEHVGYGELGHSRGLGRLDHAHIGDVMAGERIEAQAQATHVSARVVLSKDPIGDGPLADRIRVGELEGVLHSPGHALLGDDRLPIHEINATVIQLHRLCHARTPS